MLSLIAIIGKNRELGKDNKLIWSIPPDLERFRKLTAGHPVIMGRKTFESIGHPLPERTNIIISSRGPIRSIDEAIEKARQSPGADEIFIIGGGQIFAQAINLADRIYLTVINATADADIFFPDYSQFSKIISQESHELGGLRYTYL
ncbi:dihydrofolate reductase, partial [Candidatus Roizmanbacteria bacterium]|nr:dihydrofolate reductase [Candidatus Roizmanbacteria bacterium]